VAFALAGLLATSASAAAAATVINAPAGTVADVAFAIGRQAGVSISFTGNVTSRRATAIRGRMPAAAALRRLAASSGLDLRAGGPRSFILSPRRRPAAARINASATARRPAVPSNMDVPDAPPLEEIVVTASKRDTLAKRFPGQWIRIDGDDLTGTGVVGTDAISARTVGFSSTHLGAGRNKLFIRGIADSSFSGPTQSPVGQYFADLRTGYSGPDPDLRLVDMQSVEILEGPQGTLYGAGALGGIILLKPNMPDPRSSSGRARAGVSVTQHGEPGFDLSATLNAAVADGAAVRITGYHADEGGYIDNRLTGDNDINRVQVDGGRFIATAEPVSGWAVDLTATGQWIRGDDSQYSDGAGDRLSRASAVTQPFASDFALASLVLRKDDGLVRVRSTTGATWQDVTERFDVSVPGEERRLRQHSRAGGVSSETRVWRPMRNGVSWLGGVSLLNHVYRVSRSVQEADAVRDLGSVENRVREITAYGEVGVELTPKIDASLGARYTISDMSGSGQHLSLVAFDRVAAADPDRTERRMLPSASILVRPFDGLSLYARYQQGFRPGGLSIANDTVRFYKRDLLGTAEVGFRFGRPRTDRVDLAGSLIWSRWSDIQADFLDATGLPVTDNIGDGRVWSATVNGGVRINREWRVEAGVAWNDGRITRPSATLTALTAASFGRDDMSIPNIAKVVGRAAIDFERDIGFGRRVELNLYGRYVGTSRLGIGSRLGQQQGDYFDSGLVARLVGKGWAMSLSATNLADQVGNRFAFGAPVLMGEEQLTPLRPRTVRLGLDWAF
jgi:outer membrane receptor protein involved in Fe transport